MEHQRWEEARPYALAAAETWAQWGMLCAARCYEGLKDWKTADLWIRRADDRYPDSGWTNWYQFCQRTGHGDIEAARAFTEERLKAVEGRAGLADLRTAAYFYRSTRALEKARGALTQAAAMDPRDPSLAVDLALVADELGDQAGRDKYFEVLSTRH